MNIPNGVAQRIRRICSEESEYLKHKELHIEHFVNRGYNYEYVVSKFSKYDNVDRLELIGDPEISFNDPEDSVSSRRFPLVLDFHPSFSSASKAINKHKNLLNLDDSLKNVIQADKIFVTFRKSKTLGDSLVHSRYPQPNKFQDHKGNINCKNCALCKFFLTDNINIIKSMVTQEVFYINQTISCCDEHVIYVIGDKLCKRQNVGSTDGNMKVRWSNHKSHIKHKVMNCRVAAHFNDPSNNHKFSIDSSYEPTLAKELEITLIDKVVPEPWDSAETITKKLLKKESYWQHQLRTLEADGGLNVRNERLVANNRAQAKTHGN